MRGLHLISFNIDLAFISKRKLFFIFSTFLVLLSIGMFFINGLNYGIDFKGGIMMEIRTQKPADIGSMRKVLGNLGLGEISLQEFGQPTDILIRIQRQDGGEKAQQVAIEKVKTVYKEKKSKPKLNNYDDY